jgi:hypothetical protein
VDSARSFAHRLALAPTLTATAYHDGAEEKGIATGPAGFVQPACEFSVRNASESNNSSSSGTGSHRREGAGTAGNSYIAAHLLDKLYDRNGIHGLDAGEDVDKNRHENGDDIAAACNSQWAHYASR